MSQPDNDSVVTWQDNYRSSLHIFTVEKNNFHMAKDQWISDFYFNILIQDEDKRKVYLNCSMAYHHSA